MNWDPEFLFIGHACGGYIAKRNSIYYWASLETLTIQERLDMLWWGIFNGDFSTLMISQS
ncbi:hypothetical protein Scep_019942 [Stephania cephalantha]|uniref:Uncharacterized protein n=1 Tax=Stephania cephalantha TaxID=152367 RepID=A0AAP0IBU8_9MAGN